MVAINWVPAGRLTAGVNVAAVPFTVTVPLIAIADCVETLKVVASSVDFIITSEKVAVIAEFTATSAAALAGEVAETVGGVGSSAGVVATTAFDCPDTLFEVSIASTV